MIRKLLEVVTLLRCSTAVRFWDNNCPNHRFLYIYPHFHLNQSQLPSIISSYKPQTEDPNCICAFLMIIQRNFLSTVVVPLWCWGL